MPTFNAVVIGGGFGGLAAAIRLQSAGISTTLIEKNDQLGGRARVFKDQGFVFDAGPTVITAPQCIEELYKETGKSMDNYVHLLPVDPFYRLYWENGYRFNYSNNDDMLYSEISKFSKRDVSGYQKFLSYSKNVYEEGYEKLVDVAFENFWSMMRVAPKLVKLSAYRSVYSMVSKFIKSPYLRQAFSFHSLLIGGNPFSSSSIYTLIHYLERKGGFYFPEGGTGALVNGLARLFEDLGGTIILNSQVNEIVTSAKEVKGIRYEKNKFLQSNIVISNADVVHTYKYLLKNELHIKTTAKRMENKRHSMSLFVVYFGTKKKYPNLVHHNVMFGPRYKHHLNEIFNKGDLADDFSLYLHSPCKTDPSLAPPDCETFYALSPVPHLGNSTIDWSIEGPKYAKKILSYLENKYMPELSEHLVAQKIFTPLDFKQDYNAHWGSAFSLEPILTQSAYFRVHNRDDVLKGLYFVGAGTHPGAGIPGVINSAKATTRLIFRDFNIQELPRKGQDLIHAH